MKGPQKVAQVPLKKKSCLEGHEVNVVFMSDKNQKTVALTRVLWLSKNLNFCLFIIFMQDNVCQGILE